jgi:uncharacterized protein YbbK (DUF523 family)
VAIETLATTKHTQREREVREKSLCTTCHCPELTCDLLPPRSRRARALKARAEAPGRQHVDDDGGRDTGRTMGEEAT